MKKLLFIPLIFLLHLILVAQDKSLVLYGKIQNSKGDSIILSNHYGKYVAISNKNGVYRFTEIIKDPDFLNFSIGNNQLTLLMFSGDTLELNFDLNDFANTLSFTGKVAELNKNLSLISSGKLAPDFSLKDSKGKIIKLSDFKGKYVYIDVWNTSCSPCRKEFPVMEGLIEKYKNNNIAFIGISLDKSEETWLKFIEKKKLKGIQLYGEGWDSKFVKNYFIKFNPRFILIDDNQKIVYLSAPRPSGNIDNILSKLFENK
jgi:peroxiredoxin